MVVKTIEIDRIGLIVNLFLPGQQKILMGGIKSCGQKQIKCNDEKEDKKGDNERERMKERE